MDLRFCKHCDTDHPDITEYWTPRYECRIRLRSAGKERMRIWRANNRLRNLENQRAYFSKNKDKIYEKLSEWRSKNRQHINARQSAYNKRNREKISAYERGRRNSDPAFKLKKSFRHRLGRMLKGERSYKGPKTALLKEAIGCEIDFLIRHLESKFLPGMSWDNHGFGDDCWHIDHIIPLAAFDHSKIEEIKRAWHYTNLQPLWQRDNLRKRDKVA